LLDGRAPAGPTGRAYSAPQTPYLDLRVPTSKGRGGKGKGGERVGEGKGMGGEGKEGTREGKEGWGKERKGRGRGRKEWEGKEGVGEWEGRSEGGEERRGICAIGLGGMDAPD